MRRAFPFFVGTLLVGLVTGAPSAHADEPSPLYTLVDAAAARLQTADPVAAFKWVKGGPIDDPPRVRQVLAAVATDAKGHGIDPGPVRAAFEDQIRATEGIEYARFGQWKLDPGAVPTTAPDLSASRAAIDGYNRAIVGELALQQDSLHGPDCVIALQQAKSAVITDRSLDPLYQQALTLATSSYCGP
ncbi:MAG: chorismate mutase [Mycobacterium sp.]|nr:chorismate mutase [Mycobacterium sp.]MDT5400219.1 chorismate mutase [Mycobacterium sp.]MDT7756615.1 chorismate mutase [Mycobacterium sp.]